MLNCNYMEAKIRTSRIEYWQEIWELYQAATSIPGGLARRSEEISANYVKNFLKKSKKSGISLLAFRGIQMVGEIHAYKLEPSVFSHVLSELTVVVHPDHRGKGIGRALFEALLHEVESSRNDILRVELIARESNARAIKFYETLGFKREGRLEQRINSSDGSFEADIPMAWFNPSFVW